MNVKIREAIQESISQDCRAHVTIFVGDFIHDIHDVVDDTGYEDCVRENDGTYDVWGTDDNGEEWRICVHLVDVDEMEDAE